MASFYFSFFSPVFFGGFKQIPARLFKNFVMKFGIEMIGD